MWNKKPHRRHVQGAQDRDAGVVRDSVELNSDLFFPSTRRHTRLVGDWSSDVCSSDLYARLEEKIVEFERLKEFNENIVESINVGILALDLDDRIESWNAQMEAMYALSRAEAIGQELSA